MAFKRKARVVYRTRKAKRRYSKPKFTIPISILGGMAVPVGTLVSHYNQYRDINVTTREIGQFFTGYDYTTGKWNFASMRYGMLPIFAGVVAHKVANKLGVNRLLASAGIPLIRI